MNKINILSYKYNMSLGFVPVLVCFLLCEFIQHDMAIYISTVIALSASLYTRMRNGTHLPPFLLYGSTGMLVLLSVFHVFVICTTPDHLYTLAIEVAALIPPALFLLNRRGILKSISTGSPQIQILSQQSVEASLVSSRILLLLAGLHLFIAIIVMVVQRPLSPVSHLLLLRLAPPAVFLLTILLNIWGIHYFNRLMSREILLPIVNKRGDVIGKCLADDALRHKNRYILPVVRIVVSAHGMIFLAPRETNRIGEIGKTDIIIEDYLLFGETLQQGVVRILRQQIPEISAQQLRYSFMYHLENEVRNRLVYLFTLSLEDDAILNNGKYKGGKLWTFRQISDNLQKNFFSSCFEYEYDYLKEIICTTEKYRES